MTPGASRASGILAVDAEFNAVRHITCHVLVADGDQLLDVTYTRSPALEA